MSSNSPNERKDHRRAAPNSEPRKGFIARSVDRLVRFIGFFQGLSPTNIQTSFQLWRDRQLLASLERAYQRTTEGSQPLRGEFGLDQGWEPLPEYELRGLHQIAGYPYPPKLGRNRKRFDRLLRVAKERGLLKTLSH